MNKIVMSGIEFFGRHGLYKEEKILGAKFIVDIEVLIKDSQFKSIDDTLNYEKFGEIIKEEAIDKEYELIEKLANVIAEKIMEYEQVLKVTIRVHKPHAPLTFVFRDLYVEATLERELS